MVKKAHIKKHRCICGGRGCRGRSGRIQMQRGDLRTLTVRLARNVARLCEPSEEPLQHELACWRVSHICILDLMDKCGMLIPFMRRNTRANKAVKRGAIQLMPIASTATAPNSIKPSCARLVVHISMSNTTHRNEDCQWQRWGPLQLPQEHELLHRLGAGAAAR